MPGKVKPIPDGHSEPRCGTAPDARRTRRPRGDRARGGSPVSIRLYVEDVDAFVKRALAAGARERKPVEDQFYGDRSGQLEDPFGHLWWVATHKEDVAPQELDKRVRAMFGGQK